MYGRDLFSASWVDCPGVCTFFVSLAFWHHIPFRLGLGIRQPSMFFDKLPVGCFQKCFASSALRDTRNYKGLGFDGAAAPIFPKQTRCVYQYDSDLRQQGIDSFAAYIAQCDEVLVLWSPEYFTRLAVSGLICQDSSTGKDIGFSQDCPVSTPKPKPKNPKRSPLRNPN